MDGGKSAFEISRDLATQEADHSVWETSSEALQNGSADHKIAHLARAQDDNMGTAAKGLA